MNLGRGDRNMGPKQVAMDVFFKKEDLIFDDPSPSFPPLSPSPLPAGYCQSRNMYKGPVEKDNVGED